MAVFSFLSFDLDTDQAELRQHQTPVSLPPKAFSVLQYLVENRDRMVPKTELLDTFWALEVSEAALQTTLSVVRKALGKDASQSIKTYHGRGLRFIADLQTPDNNRGTPASDFPAASIKEQRLFSVLSVRFVSEHSLDHDDIAPFLEQAQACVTQSQGHLLHMMLDGFSAAFGLDPALEDSARFALLCAHEITQLTDRTPNLSVSIGVDSGAAALVCGDAASRWAPPAATERFAATLAQQAGAEDIYISAATHALLRNQLKVAPVEDGFVLLAPPPERAGVPAISLSRPSTFVGREAEMGFLRASLNKAKDAPVQTVILSGQAGIGKSRLVSEFLATLDTVHFRPARYFCLQRQNETPLAVIRSMGSDLFTDASKSAFSDAIDHALYATLMGDRARGASVLTDMSENKRSARSHALVDRLLQEQCQNTTRVIVFEDVHWIDPASRQHVEALIRSQTLQNVVFVLTTRPTDAAPFAEGSLHLGPLGRAESLSLLREVPQLADVETADLDTLAERAAGNPFFLEELALAKQSTGSSVRDVPQTVQAVIETRIAALSEPLRRVIYAVSVIGQPAPPPLIAVVLDENPDLIGTRLDLLIKQGFLQRANDGFVFRHVLLSDTAYTMIDPVDRRALHAKIANHLEGRDNAGAHPRQMLAWHFQEAGDSDKAITHWASACFDALVRSAHREGAVFAENGLRLISPGSSDAARQEVRLLLLKANALMALQGYASADVGAAFRRANSLSETLNDSSSKTRAVAGLWVHTWVSADLTAALGHARELLDMGQTSHNPTLLVQAHGGLGEVLLHTGELNDALTQLQAGMALASDTFPDSIRAQSAMVTCSAYAAWVHGMLGNTDAMYALCHQSNQLSKESENRFAEAIHYALCSEATMSVGDIDGTQDMAESAIEISREHGFPFWLGTGLVMRAWALGCRRDFEPALSCLTEGIDVFERTGAKIQIPNWYGLRAEILLRAGFVDDAQEAAQYALDVAKLTGDIWFTPRIHAIMAEISLRQHAFEMAEYHSKQVSMMAKNGKLAPSFVTLNGLAT